MTTQVTINNTTLNRIPLFAFPVSEGTVVGQTPPDPAGSASGEGPELDIFEPLGTDGEFQMILRMRFVARGTRDPKEHLLPAGSYGSTADPGVRFHLQNDVEFGNGIGIDPPPGQPSSGYVYEEYSLVGYMAST